MGPAPPRAPGSAPRCAAWRMVESRWAIPGRCAAPSMIERPLHLALARCQRWSLVEQQTRARPRQRPGDREAPCPPEASAAATAVVAAEALRGCSSRARSLRRCLQPLLRRPQPVRDVRAHGVVRERLLGHQGDLRPERQSVAARSAPVESPAVRSGSAKRGAVQERGLARRKDPPARSLPRAAASDPGAAAPRAPRRDSGRRRARSGSPARTGEARPGRAPAPPARPAPPRACARRRVPASPPGRSRPATSGACRATRWWRGRRSPGPAGGCRPPPRARRTPR